MQTITIRVFRNLKVKNPEKYGWDPKWLLSHLIDIYLHLDSEALIIALANDQVLISILDNYNVVFVCSDLSNWRLSMILPTEWRTP